MIALALFQLAVSLEIEALVIRASFLSGKLEILSLVSSNGSQY